MAKISTKIKYGLIAAMVGLMPALTAYAGSDSTSLNNGAGLAGANNGNPSYHFKRGVIHFEAKNYDKASKAFHKVQYDPRASVYMASIKTNRGHYKSAIPYYNHSLKTFEGNPALLAGLGLSYTKIEKYDRAAQVLTRLEASSEACDNTCEQAPMIAASLHILTMAMYPAE